VTRYTVRRQSDGDYCVWDAQTDKPAELHGMRYVNLSFDKACDEVILLNEQDK
jgi:hypothetical protein